jgi:hypothetical protein
LVGKIKLDLCYRESHIYQAACDTPLSLTLRGDLPVISLCEIWLRRASTDYRNVNYDASVTGSIESVQLLHRNSRSGDFEQTKHPDHPRAEIIAYDNEQINISSIIALSPSSRHLSPAVQTCAAASISPIRIPREHPSRCTQPTFLVSFWPVRSTSPSRQRPSVSASFRRLRAFPQLAKTRIMPPSLAATPLTSRKRVQASASMH